jgi:hypothetical protein
MLLKLIIIGSVVTVTAIIGIYVYYKYSRNNSVGTGYNSQSNDFVTLKNIQNNSNFNQNFNDNKLNWWDDSKNNLLSKSGNGQDIVLNKSSQDLITKDDIDNYVSSYDNVNDSPVLNNVSDDINYNTLKSEFNDLDPTKSSDNIQYNLFATPDENKFEVVTSKNLYDKSEYPLIIDNSYKKYDEIYNIDDNSNNITGYSKSINETQGIDPSMTDGYVYFPSQDDLNNQNLINIQKEIIDNRANNTSSIFLDNNLLNEESDFFIR